MTRNTLARSAAAITAALLSLTACSSSDPVDDVASKAESQQQESKDKETTKQTEESKDDKATKEDPGETEPDTSKPEETEPAETEPVGDLLPFEKGTVLRMSCGYNNAKTGMRFDADVAGEGVKLADGITYHAGDFKPTWVAIQDKFGFVIEDYYAGDKDTDNYTKWTVDDETLKTIDMFSGSASQLQEGGAAGKIVNIAEYLDKMPNFKAFLEANPIVRMSLTGSVDGEDAGAIYGSPYFDGLDDIEKMPLMRGDWVVKLLDGEGEFTADSSDYLASPVYQAYMPTEGKVEVDVVEGDSVKTITKDYDAYGNIVEKMNAEKELSGVDAVNMLREYIDKTYDGYYGTTRSDLFLGQNAAWDADEMVALLRCVVANSATLNADGEKVAGLFSREEANNSRRADLYRLAGILFGVRGLESRQDFLYLDASGALLDARTQDETYDALARMNDLVQEGLISADFVASSEDNNTKSDDYIKNDKGFMSYDYNQTQTIFNENGSLGDDEVYTAVLIPVAKWDDGEEKYMRFTESWRSAKPGGWAISKLGIGDDENKLNACLALIDYAYSREGQILLSYGPEAFRDDDNTFDFYGVEMPHISEQTYSDLWSLAKGNYTNFARQYLGSTLSFNKTQAFEMECTTKVGKEGLQKVVNAIKLGVIKHPELELTENPFYTIVPTVLPLTDEDNAKLKEYTDLGQSFSTSKLEKNVFLNCIIKGNTEMDGTGFDLADAAASIFSEWNGEQYLAIKEEALKNLLDYFAN